MAPGAPFFSSCEIALSNSGMSLVVMGVAGCGKSSLGRTLAAAQGLALIEGDDFHSAENKARMAGGIALTDADREDWLAALAAELVRHPQGAVLTCSALKLRYRELLRHARPGLLFAFLSITRSEAQARVDARKPHFFAASLVETQFATLEDPSGEAGVLVLDASLPVEQLSRQVSTWLQTRTAA